MCGFTGIIDFKKSISKEELISQKNVLAHRGPDYSGLEFINKKKYNLGFIHNRLSILDISSKANQPFVDEKSILVFNGEIYNFLELKNLFPDKTWDTNSDTEVLKYGLDTIGIDFVNHLNGMFSFAYQDFKNEKLYLCKDRLGVKPMYYNLSSDSFIFSSEPKGIFGFNRTPKEININEVYNYFFSGHTSPSRTLFQGVNKVKPGSYLEFDLTKKIINCKQFWSYKPLLIPEINSKYQLNKVFEEILFDSIKIRLRSDVPLGIYLSGGYDSSLVSAITSEISSSTINSFCIGFGDKKLDESLYARKVATHLGLNHHEFFLNKKESNYILETIFQETLDDPIADPSLLPNLFLNKKTKNHITVALTGDGGDELFAGYNSYSNNNIQKSWTNHFSKSFKSLKIPKKIISSNRKYERLYSLATASSQIQFHSESTSMFPSSELETLFKFSDHKWKNNASSYLNQGLSGLMKYDIENSLANKLNLKTDRSSMMSGVEAREPLLDYRLFDLAMNTNSDLFIHRGVKKFPIRELTHKYIPKAYMERPKSGFNMPIKSLCLDFFMNNINLIEDNFIKYQGIFDVKKIKFIRKNIKTNKLNFRQVYGIFVFQIWYKKWFI